MTTTPQTVTTLADGTPGEGLAIVPDVPQSPVLTKHGLTPALFLAERHYVWLRHHPEWTIAKLKDVIETLGMDVHDLSGADGGDNENVILCYSADVGKIKSAIDEARADRAKVLEDFGWATLMPPPVRDALAKFRSALQRKANNVSSEV